MVRQSGQRLGGFPLLLVLYLLFIFYAIFRIIKLCLLKLPVLFNLLTSRGSGSAMASGNRAFSTWTGPQGNAVPEPDNDQFNPSNNVFRGGSRGNFRGRPRGNFRGVPRGSFRGSPRGNFQGGPRGSFRGSGPRGNFQGDFRGNFQSGPRGNFRAGPGGSSRSGFRGNLQGSSRGNLQTSPQSNFRGGPGGNFRGGPRGNSQVGSRGNFQGGSGDVSSKSEGQAQNDWGQKGKRDKKRKRADNKRSDISHAPNYERLAGAIGNLSVELQREIYKHCLVVKAPVAATDEGYEIVDYEGDIESETRKGLNAAALFLIHASWAPNPADAHTFLLAHNTVHIGSKRAARRLVSTLQQLSFRNHPSTCDSHPLSCHNHPSAFVYGVEVEVPLDEPWRPKKRKERKPWRSPREVIDPLYPRGEEDDFEPGDGKGRIGLRTYRILKPLLKLPPRLRKVCIVIQEWISRRDSLLMEHTVYRSFKFKHAGLPLVAAVIAKLKARLAPGVVDYVELDERGRWRVRNADGSSSRSTSANSDDKGYLTKTFRVTDRMYMPDQDEENRFGDVDDNPDIDWLWKVPSDEEMALMETYHPISIEDFKEAESQAGSLEFALNWLEDDLEMTNTWTQGRVSEWAPVGTPQQRKERMQTMLSERQEKVDNRNLYERFRVQKMAMDPEWEDKAEALARQKPDFSVYDRVPEDLSDDDSDFDDFDEDDLRPPVNSNYDPLLAARLQRGEISFNDVLRMGGMRPDRYGPGWHSGSESD